MKTTTITLAAALAASLTTLAPAAQAQELWRKGTFALGAERLFGVNFEHAEFEREVAPGVRVTGESDVTTFSLLANPARGFVTPYTLPRVGMDYFVTDHLSIGGSLFFAHYSPDEGDSSTVFGLAPRVGYAIPFSPKVGFWPRAGLSYVAGSGGADYSDFALSVDAPFWFSLFDGFALTAAPTLDFGLAGKSGDDDATRRNIGAQFGMLGWL